MNFCCRCGAGAERSWRRVGRCLKMVVLAWLPLVGGFQPAPWSLQRCGHTGKVGAGVIWAERHATCLVRPGGGVSQHSGCGPPHLPGLRAIQGRGLALTRRTAERLPEGDDGKGKRRRPQILYKLQAVVLRLRTFIRSKLMLKINGRPVLKLSGWHVSALLFAVLFLFASVFAGPSGPPPIEVPYSEFMRLVRDDGPSCVSRLRISNERFDFLLNGAPTFCRPVKAHPLLLFFLDKHNIPFRAGAPSTKSLMVFLLLNILPFVWIFLTLGMGRRMYGDMTGTVGKSTDEAAIDQSLTFDDVAGIDKAKREVQEIVDMLKNPSRYSRLGARIPKGVLLVGPPGTGKTLLARVMANEASVPFIFAAGSSFVELFVGRGAARVRALFERARKQAPCIIFLDELDALGKQRSLRVGGSNDEVEQTLNQLLACMDGLDTNRSGVVVIAATNRYEVLDDALTRPGRLDRIVRVELPERDGREAILRVHAKRLPLGVDVDMGRVAQITPGLAGADLASLVNEAAIRAVRRSSTDVSALDFEAAVRDYYKSRGSESEKTWRRLVGSLGIQG